MKVKTVLYTIYSEMYLRQKIRVEKNYSDMIQAVILFISRIFLVVCSPMQEHIDKLEFVSQNHQQCSGSNQDTPYH